MFRCLNDAARRRRRPLPPQPAPHPHPHPTTTTITDTAHTPSLHWQVYPDVGVAAMLKNQWTDAPFGFASLNDRRPVAADDDIVVLAAPDPPGADDAMRISQGGRCMPGRCCGDRGDPRACRWSPCCCLGPCLRGHHFAQHVAVPGQWY